MRQKTVEFTLIGCFAKGIEKGLRFNQQLFSTPFLWEHSKVVGKMSLRQGKL